MINLTAVIQLISQLRGYFYINPMLSLSFAITIFSFVGIPPLIGFFAKQMVLSAALDNGYVFLSLIAILTSVIGAVYVRPLINIVPGTLNPLSETLRDKPINLSDFEMNRGVKHVDKGSINLNYRDLIAKVILFYAKFNLQVNYAPVKSKIVVTILQKIYIKNILIYVVSFCRPDLKYLTKFAKRKISDIILRTGDLLKEVIPKISFKFISSRLCHLHLLLESTRQVELKIGKLEGRRSFRSIHSEGGEGKQNLINKLSSVRWTSPLLIFIYLLFSTAEHGRIKKYFLYFLLSLWWYFTLTPCPQSEQGLGNLERGGKPLLVRTELIVKSTQRTISLLGVSLPCLTGIRLFNNQTKRFISDVAITPKIESSLQYFSLNPWFITGFTDAEGTFGIFIQKSSTSKLGFTIIPLFQIGLHKKDEQLLKDIQGNLGGIGKISYGQNTVYFKVQSLKEILTVIIPHFDKYPLISQKRADYLLFREIILMMGRGEHLDKGNFRTIINIKASLNLGLSEELKVAFPETVAVPRPLVDYPTIPDPEWVAGFVSGEGCFYIGLWKEASRRLGIKVAAKFLIAQHSRDEVLMRSFIAYFGCGKYSEKKDSGEYLVIKIPDITDKIIPFFNKHEIRGVKSMDFSDWCKAVELMKAKKHLTLEGLDEISQIKAGINKGRK